MSTVSPIQPKLLSKINEQLVLRLIQDRGPATRSEMSKSMGITFPTVAKAVSSLLALKFLEEIEDTSSGPGRPAKRLSLAYKNSQVIGVMLSGSECSIVASGLNGIIHEDCTLTFPNPAGYDSLLVDITSRVKQITSRNGMATLGIGISVPAIIDYREQRVVLSANLPWINNKTIGKDLQALLGHECVIVHDSHALCLSERLHGKAKNTPNFAMLDLNIGIGLGMVFDGRFLTGASGYSGELGHTSVVHNGELCHCGKRGCLETVASEWFLVERMSLLLRRPIEIDEILDMARSGNKQVMLELEKMCEYLAIGVAHVINIFNPETFYVSGQVFRKYPELLNVLVKKTEPLVLSPSFSICEFAHASGDLSNGTVATVINYLTDSLVPNLDGYVTLSRAGDAHNQFSPVNL